MTHHMVRILLADDSALMRTIITQVLQQEKEFQIVGEAKNGLEAISQNASLKPDLIIMDINMPLLNGLEATQQISKGMQKTAILIFSGGIDAEVSFNAMKYGAADVMKKPSIDQLNNPIFIAEFINKIKALQVLKSLEGPRVRREPLLNTPGHFSSEKKNYEMVVLGASTGGPVAINAVLSRLPKTFPLPIIIVQHLEVGFDTGYASWLNSDTELDVRLARDGDIPKAGEVLISPATHHLIFRGSRLCLDDGPRVLNQKPCVDLLFQSAAKIFSNRLIGVLLTGMGADGADGCVSIKDNQGYTIVQNKETCAIFGMPKSAIERNGHSIILPLAEIPAHLQSLTS